MMASARTKPRLRGAIFMHASRRRRGVLLAARFVPAVGSHRLRCDCLDSIRWCLLSRLGDSIAEVEEVPIGAALTIEQVGGRFSCAVGRPDAVGRTCLAAGRIAEPIVVDQ